jgi:hypothetical protein
LYPLGGSTPFTCDPREVEALAPRSRAVAAWLRAALSNRDRTPHPKYEPIAAADEAEAASLDDDAREDVLAHEARLFFLEHAAWAELNCVKTAEKEAVRDHILTAIRQVDEVVAANPDNPDAGVVSPLALLRLGLDGAILGELRDEGDRTTRKRARDDQIALCVSGPTEDTGLLPPIVRDFWIAIDRPEPERNGALENVLARARHLANANKNETVRGWGRGIAMGCLMVLHRETEIARPLEGADGATDGALAVGVAWQDIEKRIIDAQRPR